MNHHLIEVRKTYGLEDDNYPPIYRWRYSNLEFVMEGTHLGEWLGMKPTGKAANDRC